MTKTTKNKLKRHMNTCKKIFANHRANKGYYPYYIKSLRKRSITKRGKMDKETEQKVHRKGNRNNFEIHEEMLSLILTKYSVH